MNRLLPVALTLVCATGSAVQAEMLPARYQVVGVAQDDALNIRALPDGTAEIVGALAPDSAGIEVIAISDGWALVNSGETSGYVALRYLKRDAGPDWNTLQAPLFCLGTEPFWSLEIASGAGQAFLSTPDTPEPAALPILQAWPGALWAPAAALALPEGTAVLYPAECSDGMSDRRYGITVDLFLTGGDVTRYSGCCRIGGP